MNEKIMNATTSLVTFTQLLGRFITSPALVLSRKTEESLEWCIACLAIVVSWEVRLNLEILDYFLYGFFMIVIYDFMIGL